VKRLLAAAVLAVFLHLLLFSLGGDCLLKRPPAWRPLPVTVMIADSSPKAAGSKRKAVIQSSHTAVQAGKQQQIKPRRQAVHTTEKIKKVFHKVAEPPRRPKQVLRPEAAPVPLKTASVRQQLTRPAQPSSVEPPAAVIKAEETAGKPSDRKSYSAGQSHNPTIPAAASAVQMATPLYWRNPPPRYPALARRRHYTGTVILEVLVDAKGLASEVRVASSSGYALLDEAALTAVRRWQFAPGTEGGRPTAMRVKVPIRFRLR